MAQPSGSSGPTALPIVSALPDVLAALDGAGVVVVAAPTGSGKTTVLPLALLDVAWRSPKDRVLVLEPRRVAARAAARRLAHGLGEKVGQTVGFVTGDDRQVSGNTRIEVITEGVLTRRLQRDPELSGVAAVLFDEFHERSLHGDLGLALCLDARAALRPDLRLAVLSATLDVERVAALIDGPVVEAEGRRFPVDVRHHSRPRDGELERTVASVIGEAMARDGGDVLVFLPGEREIRRVEDRLRDAGTGSGVVVTPLYGAISADDQDRALDPDPAGRRKIILATNIAETSLTIEGVRVVVDAGLVRRNRFDPTTGMDHLETVRISAASADQRSGRAGRTAPGVCHRMWETTDRLVPFDPPEISRADLAGLLLEIKAWGASDPGELSWMDAPPPAGIDRAVALLREIGALDADDRLTPHGHKVLDFGAHPRLANVLVRHEETGVDSATAALVAATIAEGDPLTGRFDARQSDLGLRIDALLGDRPAAGLSIRRGVAARIRRQASRWTRRLGGSGKGTRGSDLGALVALAHPDRIAKRRGDGNRFVLANGRGAALPDGDPLSRSDYLAIAEMDAGAERAAGRSDAAHDGRVRLAAAIDEATIEALFADRIVTTERVEWDERGGDIVAVRERCLGAVVLSTQPLTNPDQTSVTSAVLEAVRRRGIDSLPWSDTQLALRSRLQLVHATLGDPWAAVDDEALLLDLDDWLTPFAGSVRRLRDLGRVDLTSALWNRVGWDRKRELERLAPERLEIANGSRVTLNYGEDGVVLAVRLQHLFGWAATPTVVDGRVPVTIHLLSPAGRPLQITQDLAGFWAGSYAQVRAEMRGRYPKHPWPEDPANTTPVAHNRLR